MTVKSSSSSSSSTQSEQVLKVERKYYEQEQLNTELSYSKPENKGKLHETDQNYHQNYHLLLSTESIKSMLYCNIQPKKCFLKTFPIVVWLSQYKLKEDLFGDVIAGITVAVMHIPQSKLEQTFTFYGCLCWWRNTINREMIRDGASPPQRHLLSVLSTGLLRKPPDY